MYYILYIVYKIKGYTLPYLVFYCFSCPGTMQPTNQTGRIFIFSGSTPIQHTTPYRRTV